MSSRVHARRQLAVALIAVVVLAAAVLIWLVTRGGGQGVVAGAVHPPTPTPTPSTPTRSTPPPGPPQETVAQATPTRFRIAGGGAGGFSIVATVCAMPWAFDIDPPGEQHHTVCWVRNKIGRAPSSNSTTSYFFGHSWAQDDQEVLNALSSAATAEILTATPATMSDRRIYPVTTLNGSPVGDYAITVWTPTGTLTYTVKQVFGVGKSDWGYLTQVHDDTVRNRIVLTTCAERGGTDYDYNIVVEAYLSSSTTSTTS